MGYLDRLYELGNNLKKAGRHITVLDYSYNSVNCEVIFHRLPGAYQKIWTIKLSFYNPDDHSNDFYCYANRVRMSFDAGEFAAFFHIAYGGGGHMRDVIEEFYENFGKSINTTIPDSYDGTDRDTMERYIYQNESIDDRDRIYIYDVRPTRGVRSELNNDKAATLCPEIYAEFREDTTLSFFFSPNKDDECSLDQIIEKIKRRNGV